MMRGDEMISEHVAAQSLPLVCRFYGAAQKNFTGWTSEKLRPRVSDILFSAIHIFYCVILVV